MNSAQRLLVIYDKLMAIAPDQPMRAIWTTVFRLDTGGATPSEDDITACLIALRAQIDFARLELTGLGVPANLQDPGFAQLKDAASPSLLNTSWHNQRNSIQRPDCRLAFLWGAWVLREKDEHEVSPETIEDLLAELNQLENSLAGASIPETLRDFIARQIATIRSALRLYEIQGIRPVSEAMRKVVGDITLEGKSLKDSAESSPDGRSRLARTAEIVAKVAKVCDDGKKIVDTGKWVAATVAPLLPFLTGG